MKKLFKTLVSAALAACVAASVLPASAVALGGGSDAENSVRVLSIADQQMLAGVKQNTKLPFYDLAEVSNPLNLTDGIYYMQQSLTFNAGQTAKNGLAVAKEATVYLYIPEGVTLTVYGGNGEKADDAGPGKTNATIFYSWGAGDGPQPESSYPGAVGKAATGGGAAIYVPDGANLILMGKGKVKAIGGNGGIASQGAKGENTTYWLMNSSNTEGWAGNKHKYTNNKDWEHFVGPYSQHFFFGAQAGAGGTGGSGAGGGGAGIGTNGANGGAGEPGAQGNAVWNYPAHIVVAAITRGTASSGQVTASKAGNIYIENADMVSGTGGTGGDPYTTPVKESWNNNVVVHTEKGAYSIDEDTVSYEVPVVSHYLDGYWYETEEHINIYVTNARAGGNGGAGGKGALVGAGGNGGAGGGGGDSGSVVCPTSQSFMSEHPTQVNAGADGNQTGTKGTDADTTFTAENRPYNTITFTGASTDTEQPYYLKNSNTITVPDYTPADANTVFKGWKVTTPAAKLPDAFGEQTNTNSAKLTQRDTVLVPGTTIDATFAAEGIYGNVVLTAVLEDAAYNIITDKCTVDRANGKAYKGETVTITGHDDRLADDGEDFNCYVVTKADDESKTVDLNADKNSFTMPDFDVKVTAKYKPHPFNVTALDKTTIIGGTMNPDGKMTGTAHKGDKVYLTLNQSDIPEGESFADFEVTKVSAGTAGTVDVVQDATGYYFIMPISDVTVKVLTKTDDYTITTSLCSQVTLNGTAAPNPASVTAHYGDDVVVTANTPVTGSDLIGFTVLQTGGTAVTGIDPDLQTGTVKFKMPNSNVEVTAKYNLHNYTISIDSGTVTGNAVRQGDGTYTSTYGAALTLHAADRTGEELDYFKVVHTDGSGTTERVESDGAYTMPASNLTITVHYKKREFAIDAQDKSSYTIDGKTGPLNAGDLVTVTAEKRTNKGYEFTGFDVTDKEGPVAWSPVGALSGQFTMPANDVTVKPKYKKINYVVSVSGGAFTVTSADTGLTGPEHSNAATAQVDDTVAFTAADPADGETFTEWVFTTDGQPVDAAALGITPDDLKEKTVTIQMPPQDLAAKATYSNTLYKVYLDGTEVKQAKKDAVVTITAPENPGHRFAGWQTADLPDLTDGQKQNPTLTFAMPAQDVYLTTSYDPLDPDAYDINIIDEEGQDSGYAQVKGVTVTGAAESTTVNITAAAKIGYEFDHWAVACADVDKDIGRDNFDPGSERTSFVMPGCAVTFTAYYKAIDPGEPSAPAQSGDTISAGTAVGIAAGAVGAGLVIWQGSELAMRIYRNKTIQIDYWPGNRIALAQLIWSRAGSPEPESDAPFADITEALDTLNDTNVNAQKAARWCVEQGLLDAKTADDGTECFEPMKHVTHLRVCLTWQNARKMGLFEVPAEPEV